MSANPVDGTLSLTPWGADSGSVHEPGRRDPRLVLAALAMLGLAITFWTGSRYPALNEKALMGGDTPLSGLAFDIVFDIFPDSSIWWALTANVVNWIVTNLKGMTFGVLFGAALLTMLSLLRKRSFDNGFSNAALGAAIGAPLGVCVNCAVPIAVGLHMGRMRLETTLSAMMASPTLNVIVVSMTFALLPIHMALIKLVLALVMVLLVVPLLCMLFLKEETELTRRPSTAVAKVAEPTGITGWIARRLTPKDPGPVPDGYGRALLWYLRAFGRNLQTISIITVPMMLLAAFLGALISYYFNNDELVGLIPRGNLLLTLAIMILIALVAGFVPAPMALDVILTIVLLNAGLRADFATVTLIALGSTSIYPFIVLWRVISPRSAILVCGSVIALSVLGGILSNQLSPIEREYERQQLVAAIGQIHPIAMPLQPPPPAAMPLDEIEAGVAARRLAHEPLAAQISTSSNGEISLLQTVYPAHASLDPAPGSPRFARLPGRDIGLAEAGVVTPLFEIDSYMFGSSIAAADVDGDGWEDILVSRAVGQTGLSLYRNIGGTFARQEIALGDYADREFLAVAFADWDGDGFPELVASTRSSEIIILANDAGRYSIEDAVVLDLPERVQATALTFADFDDDGRLDLATGAWTSGSGLESIGGRSLARDSVVYLVWNEGEREPEMQALPVTPGQTLTLLAHDFDGNGYPDLLKGDDLAGTDEVLFFGPERSTLPPDVGTQPFPYLLRTSMSYAVGDWNNDLIADIYGVQISDRGRQSRDSLRMSGTYLDMCRQAGEDQGWTRAAIRECARELRSVDAIRGGAADIKLTCDNIMSRRDYDICIALAYLDEITPVSGEPYERPIAEALEECRTFLAYAPAVIGHCDAVNLSRIPRLRGEALAARHVPISMEGNALFTGAADRRFHDEAEAQGVRFPGWGWNARFADLDQDGWQDLFVLNGILLSTGTTSPNILYRNAEGRFTDATEEFGLGDLAPSYSYALTDFDRDGDLDVIRSPDFLNMVVHRNDRPAGRALWVRLRDQAGNSTGIGATITVCTSGTLQVRAGPCQRRWLHSGGGFKSSDPASVHFGLGSEGNVSLIEVRWPDGEVSRVRPRDLNSGEVIVQRS